MYSVVLMMALSGSAETPEFGNRCGGCSGYSCSGCNGCFGGRGLFSRGCSGCSGNACCGSRHHHHRNRCCGCSGNVCSGYACSGCSGRGGLFHRNRCCGAQVCCGAAPACCGAPAPACTGTPPATPPGGGMPPGSTTAPATIVVMIPANAKLTVDGRATTSTTARRVLVTPALEVGAEYVYSLTAEVIRDGQTVAETQNVTVRGGQTTEVSFATENVAR